MGRIGLWGLRSGAVAFSLLTAAGAFILFLQFGGADGIDTLDVVRALLIFISTLWLAWGAALGLIGLTTTARAPDYDRSRPIDGKTIILMPVYNEDPVATFTRLAAMETSLRATGNPAEIHFAVLSDTRKDDIAQREELLFAKLVSEHDGIGRFFYRRRADNTGKKADFRNVILIMTTNAGARDAAVRSMGFGERTGAHKVDAALNRTFSPEFRNRLDSIVKFGALPAHVVRLVVDKFLDQLSLQIQDRAVAIDATDAAKDWLAEKGDKPEFGAREMGRIIHLHIKRKLADLMLFGDLMLGGTVVVDTEGDTLSLTVLKDEPTSNKPQIPEPVA